MKDGTGPEKEKVNDCENGYESFTFSQWAREGEQIALIGNNIFNLARLLGADGSGTDEAYRGQGDLYWFNSEHDLDEAMNTMMHTHEDFTEIVFIRKGSGKTRIGHTEYLINKGDAIVIPPHTAHACMPLPQLYITNMLIDYRVIEADAGAPTAGRLYLGPDPERRFLRESGIIHLTGQPLLAVDAMFEKMEIEYDGHDILYRESLSGLCSAFLVELYRAYVKQNSSDVNARFNSVLTYVRDHLKTVTLEDAAAHASYSRNYFSHLFYAYTDEHFTDFVNKLRISEAIRLLINSDIPIEEVGASLGYASKPFFYKMFKKFTGLTPGEMRKRAGDGICDTPFVRNNLISGEKLNEKFGIT